MTGAVCRTRSGSGDARTLGDGPGQSSIPPLGVLGVGNSISRVAARITPSVAFSLATQNAEPVWQSLNVLVAADRDDHGWVCTHMRLSTRHKATPSSILLMVVLFTATACDRWDVAEAGGPAVQVVPAQVSVVVGDTARLHASADGRVCDCRWASSDPTVAEVNAAGLVRALAPGRSEVRAIYRPNGNAQSGALVEVRAP
jgi:hypothetical protein